MIDNGIIKVRKWVDISGNKGKFLSKNLDGSQAGLHVAQTNQGKIGICDGLCGQYVGFYWKAISGGSKK